MEKAKVSKSEFFLSDEHRDDNEFISELDLITDCYYNYLSKGFTILEGIFLSLGNQGAVVSLKKEISVIQLYLEGKPSSEELISESMTDSHPKYGKRRLPEINISTHNLAQVYKHIISKSEVEIWKHNEFDLLQELAIAKCKALIRYESFINEQLKRLRSKDDEEQMVKSFHWISDANKLEKLYRLLTENEIIECEEKDFKIAFSGKSEKHSRIKWLLTSKNKLISKRSIFNFIEKLMIKAYITKVNEGILNKVIESVFIDNKGKPLANLRQSNSTTIKKSDDDLITKVIGELRFS